MQRLGKTQIFVLKILHESPQSILRFNSARHALNALQHRRLIQINENLVSITEEGIHAYSSAIGKSESLDSKIEELTFKYPGLFDPLIEYYKQEKECLTTKELSDLSRKISKLIDVEANHGEIICLHYQGYSLQKIGDQFGLSRERIRQIVNKYEGCYVVTGTKEWCLRELEKLNPPDSEIKIFPSNETLNLHHSGLEGAIKQNFIQSSKPGRLTERDRLKVVKTLGYDITSEIKNHKNWSEERLIYEIKEIAKALGKPDLMPMQLEIVELGRSDLRGAITRFGGALIIVSATGAFKRHLRDRA